MEKEKKPKLEKDIQREICAYLDEIGIMFWRSNNIPVFGRNNGGKMAFRALPKFTPRGLPDIMIIMRGKFIALEIKRPGALLKPDQVAFAKRVHLAGAMYFTVRSLQEVQDLNLETFKEEYENSK